MHEPRSPDDPGPDRWDDLSGEQGDPGHSDVLEPHLWHTRLKMPDEHRRMGFDARTEEGALIEFASSLNPSRPTHKAVAWVLIGVFAVPALISFLHLLGEMLAALR